MRKKELGKEVVRGIIFQLEVKGPWGGKELGDFWELKEEWYRKEDVLGSSREREQIIHIYEEREIEREIYYKELAHAIMEAEKSHNLLEAHESWWCGPSPSRRPENQ